MKTAIVFFMLGIAQGIILTDWFRDKQTMHALIKKGKK